MGFWDFPYDSIRLELFTIKLYGIKYKYRVVAILYLQSCICLLLDNLKLPLIFCLA